MAHMQSRHVIISVCMHVPDVSEVFNDLVVLHTISKSFTFDMYIFSSLVYKELRGFM